jgi:hypothetical protein
MSALSRAIAPPYLPDFGPTPHGGKEIKSRAGERGEEMDRLQDRAKTSDTGSKSTGTAQLSYKVRLMRRLELL